MGRQLCVCVCVCVLCVHIQQGVSRLTSLPHLVIPTTAPVLCVDRVGRGLLGQLANSLQDDSDQVNPAR